MTGMRALGFGSGLMLLAAIALGACSTQSAQTPDFSHALAPMTDMPDYVTAAPSSVVETYRYAAANPDILTHIPCYCGCGSMGHTSNYSCYVSGAAEDGGILFDAHALGCSICVDITRDVMRLRAEGQQIESIRGYIDATYSPYGPSNMQ
jgi:hypothetical protein